MSTINVPVGSDYLYDTRKHHSRIHSFSYVVAAMLSTVFLLLGQIVAVSKHRRLAGIAYPQRKYERLQLNL
jgi:hypothetical protein